MKYQNLTFREAADLDELLEKIKNNGYYLEVDILNRISTPEKKPIFNPYYYKILVECDLIEYNNVENPFIETLTGKKREIDKFIGFVKILETEQKERKEIEERKRLELSKLINDNKILEWQIKNRWWVFGISLAGGICGIISMIFTILK